jgi:cytochrome c2
MTPANLRRWLEDPPGMKPGVLMPKLGLSSDQIESLLAFLESLK